MAETVLMTWVGCSLGIFIVGCTWRILRYALTPVHLRWDLYPVAHEPAARREHGGSYMEELNWWAHPQRRSLAGEVLAMAEEIIFLKAVLRNNRRLWLRSLPFHWGLYLLAVTTLVMIPLSAGLAWRPLTFLLQAAGLGGGGLLLIGAAGLLFLRITDRELALYTSPLDRVNLGLLAIFGALSTAVASSQSGVTGAASLLASLATGRHAAVTLLLGIQIAVGGLFIAYLPFTKMIHFAAKYFTYHKVRWDDAPRTEDTRMARRLQSALDYRVEWSADHVQTGSTWGQVAASMPDAPGKDTD